MDEHTSDCTHDWLRLRHSGLPSSIAVELVTRLGSAQRVLQCCSHEFPAGLNVPAALKAIRDINRTALKDDLRWLEASVDHHVISCLDSTYPTLLREAANAPLLLYVTGDPSQLNSSQLAIVGSRNPTPTGRELAFRFGANLARLGFVITSGLAMGIDAAAHRGALAAAGATIGVMATGPDRIYPYQHQELAQQISRQGALVSEMPVGTAPTKRGFPQRNRIISGMSAGTIVVEATERSGSLITARFAGEQGREVYAVPGSILSPQSRGCHALLRDGARLVECEEDIVAELTHLGPVSQRAGPSPSLAREFQSLLNHMGYDPVTINVLVARSGLTAEEVCSMLSRMELLGVVRKVLGGNYIRVGS